MKLSQNSFDEFEYYITPSDMIEFLYCRRFIYYMKCLSIPQFEENRFKVQKGREVHEKKESQNKQYLRKKLGVVDKQIDVDLKDIKKLEKDIRESFKVVGGYFPKGTSSKARCIDCCYKNVCIK